MAQDEPTPAPATRRQHEATLRLAHAAGARTWGVALPFDLFCERFLQRTLRRLARCGDPAGHQLATALERAAASDLFLAIACDEGIPAAWQRFTDHFRPRLFALARRKGLPAGSAEELVADVIGDLLAPAPSGMARTRLGAFDGTGCLLGWLGAILLRRLADRRRAPGLPVVDAGEDGASRMASAAIPAPDADPRDSAIAAETQGALREALAMIWRSLTPQESLILSFRFLHQVPQTQIAAMLTLSESRVSRVLAQALAKLRAGLGHELAILDVADPDSPGSWRILRDLVGERLQDSRAPHDQPPVRPVVHE